MTLGSLFDGSGGFPLAGLINGIEPIWASEIEPFPIMVTKKRFPNMKHYGDVSKINGAEIEPVDIITFGSPCQDLSIAGKRAGIEGERSGLFYEAIRIIKEMRGATNGEKPKYIVWENVPGAFTSNNGEDFLVVLEGIVGIARAGQKLPRPDRWYNAGEIVGDSFSVAWRVINAEFWGVPQRRSRIFLVGCLNGGGASKILFESESLYGDTPKGVGAWQRFAADFRRSAAEDCGGGMSWNGENVAPTLTRNNAGGNQRMPDKDNFNAVITMKMRSGKDGGKGPLIQNDKSATLATGNDQTLFVPQAIDGYNSSLGDKAATLGVNCGMSTGRNGVLEIDCYNQAVTGEVTAALRAKNSDSDHIPCVCLNDQGGEKMSVTEDVTATLRAQASSSHPPLVVDRAKR